MVLSLLPPPPNGQPPAKTVKHGPTAARISRIRKVQNYHMSGLKIGEIALRLGLSERMVKYDLRDGKELHRDAAATLDQEVFIGQQLELLLFCQQAAMRDYQKFVNESNKIGAMRLVAELHAKLMTLLQSVGLVEEVAKKLTLEDNAQFNPFSDEEFLEKFDALILEARARGVKIFGL